jgi:hypothetical protein
LLCQTKKIVQVYTCIFEIYSPGSTIEDEIRVLKRGEYFGEQALIKEDKRTANIIAMSPGVECLTLDRESFTQHIGDLIELREKDYGDKERFYSLKNAHSNPVPVSVNSTLDKGNITYVSTENILKQFPFVRLC